MKKTIVLLLVMALILLPCLSFAGKEYDTEEQLNAEEEFAAEEHLESEDGFETEEPETADQPTRPVYNARTGFGLGIPYGMLGINIEALPNDYISILLGGGLYQGVMGFAFGGRGYFLPKSSIFRPRITFVYGTVGVLTKTTFNYSSYKATTNRDPINGTAIGGGFSWQYSPKWGIDFDVLYPFYSKPAGAVQKGGDTKLSIGFGYYFKSKKGSFSKK